MPDHDCSFQNDRTSELQQVLLSRNGYRGGDVKKERFNSKKLESTVLQGRGHVDKNVSLKGQSAPKKARGKESSKYFGVRFRPDLHKWVAEIRVAEWKSVDKKVWLGTFDTEVGAARAVDAARKLLKCKKKRSPNFPCLNLDAYAETIPSHLNLNHLEDDAMFKAVTLFVKHKVQAYAASFGPSGTLSNCVSVVIPHPHPVPGATSFYSHHQPSRMPLNNTQHEFPFHSQTSLVSSCEDSNLLLYQDSNLPCQALPTSSSSLSSSNSEDEELGWVRLHEPVCSFDALSPFHNYAYLMDDQSMTVLECETMNAKSQLLSLWDEPNLFFLDDIGDDELLLDNDVLVGSECCIPSDNHRAYCAQELTSVDMVSHDEMPYNNCSTYHDTSFQRTASSPVDISMLQPLQSLNNNNSNLIGPLDCLQVY